MPLSKLIVDPDVSGLMLLVDDVQNTAENLLSARISSLLNYGIVVYAYLYETWKHQLLQQCSGNERLHIFEYTSDIYGWKDGGSGVLVNLPTVPSSENQRSAVVVDSLTTLLQHYPTQHVCQWLKNCSSKDLEITSSTQALAVLHRDLHDDRTVKMLEHLADITIVLLDSSEPFSSSLKDLPTSIQTSACKVVRKFTGKNPKVTNEIFYVDSELNIRSEETSAIKSTLGKSLEMSDHAVVRNPTNNLTFNLSVRNVESEARRKVVLPYVHTSEAANRNKKPELNHLDVDDLEEDPDDDLDI